ncbi:hypothetical protein FKM82_003284 [Ascaphus truei]
MDLPWYCVRWNISIALPGSSCWANLCEPCDQRACLAGICLVLPHTLRQTYGRPFKDMQLLVTINSSNPTHTYFYFVIPFPMHTFG